MAKKPAKSSKGSFPQSTKITELDDLKDFKSYIGKAKVPEQKLVDQISKLQKQTESKKVEQKSIPISSSTFTDEDLTPVGKFMFKLLDYTMYLVPLLSVHLILNILVRMQYNQDVEPQVIVVETLTTIPVLVLLHIFVHPYKDTRVFRIVSFFASEGIGGYLLYTSHEEGYYYVMKRAPPLGTLWVWMFLEMEWQWSAVSLVVIAFWMWKKNYTVF
jgi:hypothetical protein